MKLRLSNLCLGLLLVTSQSFAQSGVSLAERELTEGKLAAAEADSTAGQIQIEKSRIQGLKKEINAIHDRITARVMEEQDSADSEEGSALSSPLRCSGQIFFITEDVIQGLRKSKKSSPEETLANFQNAKVQLQNNLLAMQACEKM